MKNEDKRSKEMSDNCRNFLDDLQHEETLELMKGMPDDESVILDDDIEDKDRDDKCYINEYNPDSDSDKTKAIYKLDKNIDFEEETERLTQMKVLNENIEKLSTIV